MSKFILFTGVLLLLTGCMGGQRENLPVYEKEALALHVRGIQQRQQGELAAAKDNLLQAYRLFAAVEDRQGSSATLLNLAALERLAGNIDSARVYLEQVEILSVDGHLGQLAYERSLLALQTGNLIEAERQAISAQNTDKTLEGVTNNLMARIHYLNQNYQLTAEYLDKALTVLPQDNLIERANAYRLRGKVVLLDSRIEEAKKALAEALILDQRLNRPDKIALDLALLADAHRIQGDWRGELTYLRRLFVVEVNSGRTGEGRQVLAKMASRLEEHALPGLAGELRQAADTYLELGAIPVQW